MKHRLIGLIGTSKKSGVRISSSHGESKMTDYIVDSAAAFIKSFDDKSEFRPFAYYDKHLDCIRVQLLDCSFKEERKHKIITVLSANHTEQNTFAGFNIKGVRFVFEQMKLPATGVYKLTDLIDKLVKYFPDAATRQVQVAFSPIMREQDLSVSVDFA